MHAIFLTVIMYFISNTKLMCRKRGCLEEKLEKQQINHNNRQP